jgi:hypothetical protein
MGNTDSEATDNSMFLISHQDVSKADGLVLANDIEQITVITIKR